MLCLQKLSKKLLCFVPSDEYRTPLIEGPTENRLGELGSLYKYCYYYYYYYWCICGWVPMFDKTLYWLRLLTYSVGRFSKDNATTVWTACADLKADLTNHEASKWLPEVAFNPDLAPRSRLVLSPFSFSYLTLRCLYKICLILTWKIRNCLLAYLCRLFKGFCQPHP